MKRFDKRVFNAEGSAGGAGSEAVVPSVEGAGSAIEGTGPAPDLISGAAEPPAAFADWTAEALQGVLPEGLTADEAQSAKLLEAINSGKGDLAATLKSLFSYYKSDMEAAQAAMSEQFNQLQTQMQNEVRSDATYGGERLDESLRVSKETALRFGGKGFMELLATTGAGNSIHMVRFLNEVAKSLPKEAAPVNGGPAATPKSLGERLFPSKG